MKKASPEKTGVNKDLKAESLAESCLQHELRQKIPFASIRAEAFLNLLRTTDKLQRQLQMALKPHGLTETQYNALRILRGAGDTPLPCSEVGERLIHDAPDITRLLDRLERNGLIRRQRDLKDRRIVLSQITAEGLAQLKKLDGVVESSVDQMLGHMNQTELRQIVRLLVKARNMEKNSRKS
ncbi:MAG TPA: MarR family transcriptional regulator [Acidobacteriaceae bacterium]|jgi:DNA-binding MarR family transcriptional regulator|nr:MarR family transcriptional regulator [Acidobacteriaceae bacterium]